MAWALTPYSLIYLTPGLAIQIIMKLKYCYVPTNICPQSLSSIFDIFNMYKYCTHLQMKVETLIKKLLQIENTQTLMSLGGFT